MLTKPALSAVSFKKIFFSQNMYFFSRLTFQIEFMCGAGLSVNLSEKTFGLLWFLYSWWAAAEVTYVLPLKNIGALSVV